jgi:hypothetical protein
MEARAAAASSSAAVLTPNTRLKGSTLPCGLCGLRELWSSAKDVRSARQSQVPLRTNNSNINQEAAEAAGDAYQRWRSRCA